jgi:hypothetical protein
MLHDCNFITELILVLAVTESRSYQVCSLLVSILWQEVQTLQHISLKCNLFVQTVCWR